MPPENGRVLKTRIGMNPHSVGHGILFGSMAFVPYAVVSAFLIKACLSPSLDEALKQYRQRPSPGRLRRFVAACWGLSWLDFSGVWTFLMSRMVGAVSPYLLGSLSAALSAAVSYLAYRVTDEPPVAALTVRKLGLLPLSLGVLLALTYGAGGSGLPGVVLLCVAYGYLTPLAIILCGVAATLGGILKPDKKVAWAGAAYVGGGLLALVLPPYPWGGYNPAGLLFPIWGGFCRRASRLSAWSGSPERRHENTEDTL
ncbi:MAG TPA: hypothetical protein GX510_03430 [Firmicutes bacterium]|nr:hypothetical protein [Candidatus Fermentithermobacillaceae bacterium]